MQITFLRSGCLDKGCSADKCDCRLTLAVWTVAELIRLMNVWGWQWTVLWEERRGQDRLTSSRWRKVRYERPGLAVSALLWDYLESWSVGPEGSCVWNYQAEIEITATEGMRRWKKRSCLHVYYSRQNPLKNTDEHLHLFFGTNSSVSQSAPPVPGEDFTDASHMGFRLWRFEGKQLFKMSCKCCDESLTNWDD